MKALDLTHGPISQSILRFALPLLATSVVQQLYTTVDLLFAGNALKTQGAAALGVGSLLITLVIGLFTGISVGVNVKIANLYGAGDRPGLKRAISTTAALGLCSSALLTLVGFFSSEGFVAVMNVPAESLADTTTYLSFAVAAIFPIGIYNICSGALRGLGDSRSPLIAQGIGGLINIAANWLALYVLEWGIAGCAAATFVANGLAATLAAWALMRSRRFLAGEQGTVSTGFAASVLAFGAPVAIQTVAIVVSNILVQRQIDTFGVESVAAFAIYLKVELPIYFVILAIGQATTTFVAQNLGAGLIERCSDGVRICQVICLVLSASMSALMLAIGHWAFWIFDSTEPVISIGLSMAFVSFPFYFLYAILEVQADAMRGYGRSLAPAVIVFATIYVLRVILVHAFTATGLGIEAIAATYPITWGAAAACMALAQTIAARRMRTRLEAVR